MKAEEKAFLETMKKFRKLHISSMLPGINSGDFAVMKTIDPVSYTHLDVYKRQRTDQKSE